MRQRTCSCWITLRASVFTVRGAVHTHVACTQLEPTSQYPCVSQSNLVVDFFHCKSYFSISLCAWHIWDGCQVFGVLLSWVQSILYSFLCMFLSCLWLSSVTWTRGSRLASPWASVFLRAPPVVPCELRFPLWLLETLPDPGELWRERRFSPFQVIVS